MKSPKKSAPLLNSETAKALLEKDKQERVQRASEKVQAAMASERCAFDYSITITAAGRVIPNISIVPLLE